MNPVALQTLQIMLSMLTSDKISDAMKKQADKVTNNLLLVLTKDSDEYLKENSSLLS